MNIFDITNEIKVVSKAEFALNAYSNFDNQDIIFTSLSCVDLMNLAQLKNNYDLLNARFLLIYQFQNLSTHERKFYAVALSYGQTMHSYAHLFSALSWYEVEVERGFGIHFYQKEERIQHEIITPAQKYFLEKDIHEGFEEVSVKSSSNFEGEEVVLPIQKFLNPCSKSLIRFDIVADEIKRADVELDYSRMTRFEKNVEGRNLDDVTVEILASNFSNKYLASLLCLETKEYISGLQKSSSTNIQRMFALELFLALDNLKCIENIFKSCGITELYHLVNKQWSALSQSFGVSELTNIESLETLLEKEDRKWLYDIRDKIHEFQYLVDEIISVVEGNEFFLKRENYFNCGLSALDFSLKSAPMQSLGYHYNIRKYESFYEYDDLGTSEVLSLYGTTYELILIRLQELKNTYSNIIKVCEEYPIVKSKFLNSGQGQVAKSGLFLSTTQVSSGELSLLTYINSDQSIERLHYISPSIVNIEYFRSRLNRFALSQISCEWNSLGIDEEELLK